jgi:hypothetical protein
MTAIDGIITISTGGCLPKAKQPRLKEQVEGARPDVEAIRSQQGGSQISGTIELIRILRSRWRDAWNNR